MGEEITKLVTFWLFFGFFLLLYVPELCNHIIRHIALPFANPYSAETEFAVFVFCVLPFT